MTIKENAYIHIYHLFGGDYIYWHIHILYIIQIVQYGF